MGLEFVVIHMGLAHVNVMHDGQTQEDIADEVIPQNANPFTVSFFILIIEPCKCKNDQI